MSRAAALVIASAVALFAQPAPAVECLAAKQLICAASGDGHHFDFNGACQAQLKGYWVLHAGHCEAPDPVSACPHLYNPICGVDPMTQIQHTYSNMCAAEVATAQYVHDGSCTVQNAPH
jgi:hypothetical protein